MMNALGFNFFTNSIANSQSLPILMYSGVFRLVKGVAFDHGVHGGLSQIKSGCGHIEKSKSSTSAQTPRLRFADFLQMSMLYTFQWRSSEKTRPTEPVPEKMSNITGVLGLPSETVSIVVFASKLVPSLDRIWAAFNIFFGTNWLISGVFGPYAETIDALSSKSFKHSRCAGTRIRGAIDP